MGGNRVNQETSMHIKSILTSEERFVSGDLVNHAATGSPQDESVRYVNLWPVHPGRHYLCLGHGPQGRGHSVTSL
jgi:hypothetical protein